MPAPTDKIIPAVPSAKGEKPVQPPAPGNGPALPPKGQDPDFVPKGKDPDFVPKGKDPAFVPPGKDPLDPPPGKDPAFVPPGKDPEKSLPHTSSDEASGDENQILTIDVLANDKTPKNGVWSLDQTKPAAFTAPGSVEILPSGARVWLENGAVVYDPGTSFDHLALDAQATDSFIYAMKTGQSDTSLSYATVTVRLTGTNDAPVATLDSVAGDENESLTIDVLANDTDVDDGAVLSLVSASAPAGKGSVAIVGGELAFDPGEDFDHLAAGAEEIVEVSYTIEDEHGAQSGATVEITVHGSNDAPTVDGALSGIAESGGAASTLDALANADDVDDGATLAVIPGALPPGVSFDPDTNSFTLDPAHLDYQGIPAGETVVVSVDYGVSDGMIATPASLSWTVSGSNSAPTIVPNTAVLSGGYVDVTGAAAYTGTGAYSYEVSFRTDHTGSYQTLLSVGTFSLNKAAGISIEPSGVLGYSVNGAHASVIFGPFVTDGEWHTATLTYNGAGHHSLYLDGQLVGSSFYFGVNLTGGPVLIGAANSDYRNRFEGDIAEAHIWNRALSASEVQDLSTPAAGSPGLIGSYLFSGDATNSASGLPDGVIVGAVDFVTIVEGAVTELPDGAAGEGSALLEANGTIQFADADSGDVHSAAASPQGEDYVGTLAMTVDQDADSVGWSFEVADAALDALGAGEVAIQTYTVSIGDGKGGFAEQSLVITLIGAADAAPLAAESPTFGM